MPVVHHLEDHVRIVTVVTVRRAELQEHSVVIDVNDRTAVADGTTKNRPAETGELTMLVTRSYVNSVFNSNKNSFIRICIPKRNIFPTDIKRSYGSYFYFSCFFNFMDLFREFYVQFVYILRYRNCT